MNAYQSTFNGANVNNGFGSAFLSKIDTANSTLVYSTYLSGNAANGGTGDIAYGVAVDTSNNAYVVGQTSSNNSTNFPSSTNANETAPPALNVLSSAFVTKINTAGSGAASLVYSTYIAGSVQEIGFAIALGPNNVAYVTGLTDSTDFPTTAGAFDNSGSGAGKAFISVIDTTKTGAGNSLVYSTLLGGGSGDTGYGITVDGNGNAYVVGTTTSGNFPGTNTGTKLGGFQTTRPNSAGSPFIAKLFPGGKGTADLLYSTYFGGSGDGTNTDQGFGIAIDSANPPNAYITGHTFSTNLPVTGAGTPPPQPFQKNLSGSSDAYVAKLPLIPTLAVVPFPASGATIDFGTVQIGTTSAAKTVTLTNNTTGNIAFTSAVVSGANAADFAAPTASCNPNIVVGTPCVVSITFAPTAPPAAEVATLTITDADSTSPQVFTLKGSGTNVVPDFTITATAPAPSPVKAGSPATFTVTVTPIGGFSSPVTIACTEPAALTLSTCTAAQSPITPNGGAVMTVVTVTTTAPSLMTPPPSNFTQPMLIRQIVPLLLALILLFLLPTAQRRRLRLGMAAATLALLVLAGCSGSGTPPKPGTPPGTYALTVTGTSGATMHTVTPAVSVTVD
jgi:hypothetical protein